MYALSPYVAQERIAEMHRTAARRRFHHDAAKGCRQVSRGRRSRFVARGWR